ncbi:MAG: hypothetical protein KAS87_06835, partial [Candidatus Omnitrophica bacterium]|nr:hypothetical protein [Candidatus Omnitrophota bacterium]
LVLRGEIKIKPDTKDKATDDILKVLQLNYDEVGAGKKIETLAKLIEERISEWDSSDFRRHIESALYFREIVKVTLIIRGMAHTKQNLDALEEIEKKMEKHLLAYYWPATFFVEDTEVDTGLLKIIPQTQDQKINEILGLLQVFFADEDYRKDLLKNLRQDYVGAKFKDIEKGRLDEFIDGANLLCRAKEILDKIAVKDLSKLISKKLEQNGWPVSNRKFEDKSILWQKYLQILQKSSGLKDKEEIEKTKEEAEKILKQAKELEAERVLSLYDSDIYQEKIFEILWGVQTARAPTPIKFRLEQLDKEFLKDLMDDKQWNEKYYDVAVPKLHWIKTSLSEILASLNKDNAYQPQECAKIIKSYIDKIDQHFKKYHRPKNQRIKYFDRDYDYKEPMKIGVVEPIVVQPTVDTEQIEKWKTELAELEKSSAEEASEVVELRPQDSVVLGNGKEYVILGDKRSTYKTVGSRGTELYGYTFGIVAREVDKDGIVILVQKEKQKDLSQNLTQVFELKEVI